VKRDTLNRIFAVLFLLLVLAYPFIFGKSSYYLTLMVMICVYAITSMALNLLVGFGGQMSVGHAGFLSIGGYAVAMLSTKMGVPIYIALPLAGVITGGIGFIIGLPAVKLHGHFLAVATLGFGLSIPHMALYFDEFTGGYSGMPVERPDWLAKDLVFFYVVILITVVVTWLLLNIVKSRMGRAFMAIRESEVAAQATGIPLAKYKTLMFVISAFFTGLAGGLYGYWVGFVSPNDFTATTSFLLLAMIVVGGLASIPGAIAGALILTIIPEFTADWVGMTSIVIGAAIVLVTMFRPNGLVSILDWLWPRLGRMSKKPTGIDPK
jgi:branched-chain amino acid transport system permease protein